MSDEEDKSSKTEEPTDRKLRQAREKGDVASSREAGNMMSVLALFTLVAFILPVAGGPLIGVLRGVFETAGQVGIGEGGEGIRDIGGVVWALCRGIGVTMTPVLAVLLFCAFAGVALQGEVVVALERIKPKWSKLSPIGGLKRLVSLGNLVEFAKSMVKVLVVGTIALTITYHTVMQLAGVPGLVPEMMPGFARRAAMQILMLVTVLLAFLTVADILWKRFEWKRKQRMSFREVKDEMKETEGDPHIKGKRQAIQREKSRRRMSQAVPRATVILTNPTHYAVALRYDGGAEDAPICVAKGADLMAAQIRKLAREADVPIIENKPLARALYDVAEIDREIPLEHWEAVAAIIAYVLDLGRNVRRAPPKGSSLRYGD